jgi:phosphoglycerol transferase MdoB-like AlkP superfamily enzyme
MSDILVDIDSSKKSPGAIFSKIAFYFSILTFLIFTIHIVNIWLVLTHRGGNLKASELTGALSFFSMILGLTFSIISLIRKEKIKYIKILAASINIALFVIIIALVIYALIMNFKSKHN